MGPALLLLLQAAAAAPPERIDLLQSVPPAGCRGSTADDIVVCGDRGEPYRLAPLPPRSGSALIPKAEVSLFGGKAVGAVETEAATMPNGVGKRLIARITLPL